MLLPTCTQLLSQMEMKRESQRDWTEHMTRSHIKVLWGLCLPLSFPSFLPTTIIFSSRLTHEPGCALTYTGLNELSFTWSFHTKEKTNCALGYDTFGPLRSSRDCPGHQLTGPKLSDYCAQSCPSPSEFILEKWGKRNLWRWAKEGHSTPYINTTRKML